MRLFLFLLLVLFHALPFTAQADFLEPSRTLVDTTKAKASQFYLDRAAIDGVIAGASRNEEARKAMEVVNAPEFQQKVDQERVRLQHEVFGTPAREKTYYANPKAEKQGLASDERVYLFVSSSMPEATLRAYVRDISKLQDPNITIVLRGFVGGMKQFQPTMQFISNLLKKDRSCEGSDCPTHQVAFEIDPNLYRRFKPSQVPALVYARGVTLDGPGVSEGFDAKKSSVPTNPWWVIYGDASLSYLFARVAEDAASPALANFAENLR